MGWTPAAIRALRTARHETQSEFAEALGVDRTTVSLWENGKGELSTLSVAALDALAGRPVAPSEDYQRGVLYAVEAMSETIARLLREQRESDAEAVRARALATLAAASAAPAPGDPPASATPATRRRRA